MKFKFIYQLIPAFLRKRIEIYVLEEQNTLSEKQKNQDENFQCPICEQSVKDFDPLPFNYLEEYDKHGFVHSLFCFETLNFLHYSCPQCYASDRNRLIWLYLKEELKTYNSSENHFLDIAPDFQLRKKIRQAIGETYRTADLFMSDVDDKVDICNMDIYSANSFNYLLCSHVLEHVEDDNKALNEFFRILKPGGKAILLVPILLTLEKDLEDQSIASESDRWKYYGLGDHLRLHSKKGFQDKIISAGFKLETLGIDHFGDSTFFLHGLNKKSVLYIAQKP